MGASDTSGARLWPLVILLGGVFALGSLGIDAVLPVLSQIAADLKLANPNIALWLVTAFVLGMGLGNLTGGPLSDSFGRKKIIATGLGMYIGSSLVMSLCSGLLHTFDYQMETMLFMRVIQGVGASFATVAATAMIRDVHTGPAMAKIMSASMVIFAMMPAIAPFLGKSIADVSGWPFIFVVFALFGTTLAIYLKATVSETNTHLTPLSVAALKESAVDVIKIQIVRRAILAQLFNFGILFTLVSTIQPIFHLTFGRSESFPGYFALMALAIAAAGISNGKAVQKFDPLTLSRAALAGQALAAGLALKGLEIVGPGSNAGFCIFMIWGMTSFFCNGFSIGNLTAVALEPAGEHAGMAATLIASVPLIGAVALAAPISIYFDGTPKMLLSAVVLFGVCSAAAITVFKRKVDEGLQGQPD